MNFLLAQVQRQQAQGSPCIPKFSQSSFEAANHPMQEVVCENKFPSFKDLPSESLIPNNKPPHDPPIIQIPCWKGSSIPPSEIPPTTMQIEPCLDIQKEEEQPID